MFIIIFLILSFLTPQTGEIRSSDLSRQIVNKVKPRLESRMKEQNLEWGSQIYIRIFKQEKELELWVRKDSGYVLFKTYPVCDYGLGKLGPKKSRGDRQAPEGFYNVTAGQMNPYSKYHLSFDIGYPNEYDRYYHRTGGFLMVHGGCLSNGCYAMTDKYIEEIYAIADAVFRNGGDHFMVHIFPFRMTPENMQKHQNDKSYSFWENLKEGYDFFGQNSGNPPVVTVQDGKYIFQKSESNLNQQALPAKSDTIR